MIAYKTASEKRQLSKPRMSTENQVVSETARLLVDRFPSRHEALLVFAASVFVIHIWSTVLFLVQFPASILRASIPEVIGVYAYVQGVALLESVILVGFIILLAAILPHLLLRTQFVAKGAVLVIILAFWAMSIQAQGEVILRWNLLPLAAVIFVSLFLVHRSQQVAERIRASVERLMVLSLVYIFIDIAAIIFTLIWSLLP